MNIHNDPDDVEYRTAMELQARKITGERFFVLKTMPLKFFLHLVWI